MSTKCATCKRTLRLGDWPYCPHDSTRPEYAQRFKPIVVFKSTDGKFSFPMRSDQPVPAGYQRVEISTRRQAEKLEREVNRSLREEKQRLGPTPFDSGDKGLAQLRRLARGERVTIPDHDNSGNLIMRELDGSQMRGEFKRYVDELVERQRSTYTPSYDPGFHIDVMHNDSTNRAPHDDASTGWRNRRE